MQTGTRNCRRACASMFAALAVACLMGAPAPAGAQEGPSPVQRVLSMAPEGAWAALAVDMQQVLDSGVTKQFTDAGVDLPEMLSGMKAAGFFLLPVELPIEDMPPWCGVVLIDPQAKDVWQAKIAEDGDETTIEGITAYEGWSSVSGFAGDEVLLLAGDEEMFTAALRAGEGSGANERLAKLLEPLGESMAFGAAALPEPLGKLMPEDESEDMPSYMLGITDAAFSARLEQKLLLAGFARMVGADDAQAAVVDAKEGLATAKEEMNEQIRDEPMMAMAMLPFMQILNSVKVEAREAEFHGSIEIDMAQMGMMAPMAMMPFFMFSSAMHTVEYGDEFGTFEGDGELNLHEIGLGIAMYQNAHDAAYPPNLAALVQEGFIEGAGSLKAPLDTQPRKIGDTEFVTSYEYVGSLPAETDASTIICYTRKGVQSWGRYVLTAGISVELVDEEDLSAAQGPANTSLRASYEAVVKAYGDKLTEERKAELKKFYEIEE